MGIKDSLLAVWKFDNDLTDAVGNRTLTTDASLTYDTGKFGNALRTLSYAEGEVPAYNNQGLWNYLGENWSLNFWAKVVNGGTGFIFGLVAEFNGTTFMYVTLGSSSGILYTQLHLSTLEIITPPFTNLPVFDNNWHMFTVVYNRLEAIVKIYTDGGLRFTKESVSDPGEAELDLFRIGRQNSNTTGDSVLLDEIWLWNKVLTDDDVAQLWNGGNGYTYGSPKVAPLYWLITGKISAEINLKVQQNASPDA